MSSVDRVNMSLDDIIKQNKKKFSIRGRGRGRGSSRGVATRGAISRRSAGMTRANHKIIHSKNAVAKAKAQLRNRRSSVPTQKFTASPVTFSPSLSRGAAAKYRSNYRGRFRSYRSSYSANNSRTFYSPRPRFQQQQKFNFNNRGFSKRGNVSVNNQSRRGRVFKTRSRAVGFQVRIDNSSARRTENAYIQQARALIQAQKEQSRGSRGGYRGGRGGRGSSRARGNRDFW